MKTEQPTQTRDGICEREIPDPHVLIYSSYSVGAKKKSQQIVAPTRSNQSIYSGISPMMNQWTNGSICHGSSVSCRSSRSYQMYIRNMLAFFLCRRESEMFIRSPSVSEATLLLLIRLYNDEAVELPRC